MTSELISVKDRLPEDNEKVLCCRHGYIYIGRYEEEYCWEDDRGDESTPTHWITLPEPPKEEV